VLSGRALGRTAELANTVADPAKVLLTAGQQSLKKLRLWRPLASLQRLSLQSLSGRTPPAVGEACPPLRHLWKEVEVAVESP
jgi:hypothetical protein